MVGPQEAIEAICIGPDDDMEKRRKDIAKAIGRVGDLTVDMLDGSSHALPEPGVPAVAQLGGLELAGGSP